MISEVWKKNIIKIINILRKKNPKNPKIIGILGPQGIGKSTIANYLSETIQKSLKKKSKSISLDDFYLTYKQREKRKIKFRGPPGTHDFLKLEKFIKNIKNEKINKIEFPIFNKGLFNGKGDFQGYQIIDKPDYIIWEGWFNGLLPVYCNSENFKDMEKYKEFFENYRFDENELKIKQNKIDFDLENEFGNDIFKFDHLNKFINENDYGFEKNVSKINLKNDFLLKKYVGFWDFYFLIILKPLDFKFSFDWRLEAEDKNKDGKMSEKEIKEFVQYFMDCLNPDIYYDYLIQYRKKNCLKTIIFTIDKKHEIIDSEFINF